MSMTMKDYSEKRDFHRMQVNSEIEITDANGQQFNGICRDLSGTGMRIALDRPLLEGSELSTLLPSPNESFPPFKTDIKVLRCASDGEGFLLGTAITAVK